MFNPSDFTKTASKSQPNDSEKETIEIPQSMLEIFEIGLPDIKKNRNVGFWIEKFNRNSSSVYYCIDPFFKDFLKRINADFAKLFPNTIAKVGSITSRETLSFMQNGIFAIFEEVYKLENRHKSQLFKSAAKFLVYIDYYYSGHNLSNLSSEYLAYTIDKEVGSLRELYNNYLYYKLGFESRTNSNCTDSIEQLAG